MRMLRRTAFVGIVALPLLGGCRGLSCGHPPLERHVNTPTTLEAVKALHHPPDVVVNVERKQRDTSSHLACGHSIACVIVLPIALAAPFFPEKWDEATVTEDGAVRYWARFSTGGEFLEAIERKDGVARAIGVLALRKAEKRLIIELARAPIGPDGKDGKFEKTPILPQVDLKAVYTEKLASFRQANDRAALLEEYATWLRDESLPWLTAVVPKEPGDVGKAVLAALCSEQLAKEWPAGCAGVLDAIAEAPAMPLAVDALRHSLDRDGREQSLKLGRYLVDQACGNSVEQALPGLVGLDQGTPERAARGAALIEPLRETARACKTEHRTHLAVALGDKVSQEDIARAVRRADGGARVLLEMLPVDDSSTRTILIDILREHGERDAFRSRALQRLAFSKVPPDGAEIELLVSDYLAADSDAKRRASDRACTLARLATAREANVPLEGARSRIDKALAGAPAAEHPALAIALVHAGQADRAGLAASAFTGAVFVPHICKDVMDDNSLVGFGLFRAGCEPAEAIALQEKAAQRRDGGAPVNPAPNRLCVRLDRKRE